MEFSALISDRNRVSVYAEGSRGLRGSQPLKGNVGVEGLIESSSIPRFAHKRVDTLLFFPTLFLSHLRKVRGRVGSAVGFEKDPNAVNLVLPHEHPKLQSMEGVGDSPQPPNQDSPCRLQTEPTVTPRTQGLEPRRVLSG